MKRADVVFLSVAHLQVAHREALVFGGGADGVRDAGQVEAAAMAPRNAYYDTLADLASVYVVGIAESQAFLDGNKRTAIVAALTFLAVNGVTVTLDPDVGEAALIGLATKTHTRADVAAMFTDAMGGDPIALDE
jgi:death on curing protein